MDCFCEMGPRCCTLAGRVVVSASQTLLEEKYRRAMAFGKYLESHPDVSDPLIVELKRSTCIYRMAIANVLESRLPKEPKKRGKK